MIMDQLENLSRYHFEDENMEEARNYLLTHDIFSLEETKHVIKDGEIMLLFNENIQKHVSEGKFEAHRKFVDIHIPLEGTDFIRSTKTSKLVLDGEYSEENDILFGTYEGKNYTDCYFTKGSFGVYYPEDAHLVNTTTRVPETIKKFVMKIKLK